MRETVQIIGRNYILVKKTPCGCDVYQELQTCIDAEDSIAQRNTDISFTLHKCGIKNTHLSYLDILEWR